MDKPRSLTKFTARRCLITNVCLVFFARDPFQDIRRAVAKHDPAAFARPQEADNLSIHEDHIFEIQHEASIPRFRSEQRGKFAHVVGSESSAHR